MKKVVSISNKYRLLHKALKEFLEKNDLNGIRNIGVGLREELRKTEILCVEPRVTYDLLKEAINRNISDDSISAVTGSLSALNEWLNFEDTKQLLHDDLDSFMGTFYSYCKKKDPFLVYSILNKALSASSDKNLSENTCLMIVTCIKSAEGKSAKTVKAALKLLANLASTRKGIRAIHKHWKPIKNLVDSSLENPQLVKYGLKVLKNVLQERLYDELENPDDLLDLIYRGVDSPLFVDVLFEFNKNEQARPSIAVNWDKLLPKIAEKLETTPSSLEAQTLLMDIARYNNSELFSEQPELGFATLQSLVKFEEGRHWVRDNFESKCLSAVVTKMRENNPAMQALFLEIVGDNDDNTIKVLNGAPETVIRFVTNFEQGNALFQRVEDRLERPGFGHEVERFMEQSLPEGELPPIISPGREPTTTTYKNYDFQRYFKQEDGTVDQNRVGRNWQILLPPVNANLDRSDQAMDIAIAAIALNLDDAIDLWPVLEGRLLRSHADKVFDALYKMCFQNKDVVEKIYAHWDTPGIDWETALIRGLKIPKTRGYAEDIIGAFSEHFRAQMQSEDLRDILVVLQRFLKILRNSSAIRNNVNQSFKFWEETFQSLREHDAQRVCTLMGKVDEALESNMEGTIASTIHGSSRHHARLTPLPPQLSDRLLDTSHETMLYEIDDGQASVGDMLLNWEDYEDRIYELATSAESADQHKAGEILAALAQKPVGIFQLQNEYDSKWKIVINLFETSQDEVLQGYGELLKTKLEEARNAIRADRRLRRRGLNVNFGGADFTPVPAGELGPSDRPVTRLTSRDQRLSVEDILARWDYFKKTYKDQLTSTEHTLALYASEQLLKVSQNDQGRIILTESISEWTAIFVDASSKWPTDVSSNLQQVLINLGGRAEAPRPHYEPQPINVPEVIKRWTVESAVLSTHLFGDNQTEMIYPLRVLEALSKDSEGIQCLLENFERDWLTSFKQIGRLNNEEINGYLREITKNVIFVLLDSESIEWLEVGARIFNAVSKLEWMEEELRRNMTEWEALLKRGASTKRDLAEQLHRSQPADPLPPVTHHAHSYFHGHSGYGSAFAPQNGAPRLSRVDHRSVNGSSHSRATHETMTIDSWEQRKMRIMDLIASTTIKDNKKGLNRLSNFIIHFQQPVFTFLKEGLLGDVDANLVNIFNSIGRILLRAQKYESVRQNALLVLHQITEDPEIFQKALVYFPHYFAGLFIMRKHEDANYQNGLATEICSRIENDFRKYTYPDPIYPDRELPPIPQFVYGVVELWDPIIKKYTEGEARLATNRRTDNGIANFKRTHLPSVI